MKWKVIVLFFMAIMFLSGSGMGSKSVHAQTFHDWRKGDYLISPLQDGDGKNRVFEINTRNLILPDTEIRLFENNQEVPSKDFTFQYENHTIEIADTRPVPDPGAELYIEYRINPTFEWGEGVDTIGTALSNGDGKTRTFKILMSDDIKLIKSKTYLKINNVNVRSSDFTIDDANRTVTVLPSIAAPASGAKIWFYYHVEAKTDQTSTSAESAASSFPGEIKVTASGSISISINTTIASNAVYYFVISNEKGKEVKKIKLNPEKPDVPPTLLTSLPEGNYALYVQQKTGSTTLTSASVTWTASGTAAGTTQTGTVQPSPFSVPSGENFPGTIVSNSNGTFTIRLTAKMHSTESAFFIVKNTNGHVVKRVLLNPETPFTAKWSQLNLATGGYYYYLKIANQSGESAASIPQFIPINNESFEHIQVLINGQTQSYEQPAVNKNGRVLVPLRAIFESLGAKVEWNNSTQTVTATKGDITIVLTIGAKVAYVNGNPIDLDVPAQLINEKTMVPIRFVSEALGAEVKWDALSQSVITFTAPPSIDTTNESERVQAAAEGEDSSPILTQIAREITKPADIVFVIDVTASMGETIDYVRESVKNFVDAIPNGSNFSVVAFRDISDPYAPDLEYFDFTSDKNQLKANLDMLIADGGGDLDESGLEGIDMAVSKLSNRSNSKRIIFITDAPVHDKNTAPGTSSFSLDDVNSELQTNQITFDAIAPKDGLSYEQLRSLADDNNGTMYDIRDTTVLKLE